MKIKSAELAWLVVSDLKKARKFFTEVLGLKEKVYSEEYGWIELQGEEGGMRIGVCTGDPSTAIGPGEGAVITFTVDNLKQSTEDLKKQGVSIQGEMLEVPGEVKLQTFKDQDGNFFQLVEKIRR